MKDGAGIFKIWDVTNGCWYVGDMNEILEFNWHTRGPKIGQIYIEIKNGNYEITFQEDGEFFNHV